MRKKKKIKGIEFCLNKAENLINISPKIGLAYLEKAKKDSNKIFKDNGKSDKSYKIIKSIESLSNKYVNLY